MTINLFDKGGCPLDRQRFTWKELVQKPISKLLRTAVLQAAA